MMLLRKSANLVLSSNINHFNLKKTNKTRVYSFFSGSKSRVKEGEASACILKDF